MILAFGLHFVCLRKKMISLLCKLVVKSPQPVNQQQYALLTSITRHIDGPITVLHFLREVQSSGTMFVRRYAERTNKVSATILRILVQAELSGTDEINSIGLRWLLRWWLERLCGKGRCLVRFLCWWCVLWIMAVITGTWLARLHCQMLVVVVGIVHFDGLMAIRCRVRYTFQCAQRVVLGTSRLVSNQCRTIPVPMLLLLLTLHCKKNREQTKLITSNIWSEVNGCIQSLHSLFHQVSDQCQSLHWIEHLCGRRISLIDHQAHFWRFWLVCSI